MSRRAVLLPVIGTVAAAVLGATLWLALREEPPPQACDIPETLGTAVAGAATSAPDGGGIHVVEKGFTQLEQHGSGVSAGAVLENTSALVAYRTRVVLRVLDGTGRPATADDSPQLIQEVPVILPGQRIGVGSFAYLAGGQQAASFEVELQAVQWFPRGALGGYGGATGAFERIHRFDPADTEPAYIDYTVTVSSCRTLTQRKVAAIYRDATGAIIGGTLEASAQRGSFLCEPGSHRDWISADGLPPAVDPARTEFFPYCDPGPKPVPTATGGPWN